MGPLLLVKAITLSLFLAFCASEARAGFLVRNPLPARDRCQGELTSKSSLFLDLDVDGATNLSRRAVFKIKDLKSGKYYVVRFQSKNDGMGHWHDIELVASDSAFEVFSAKIANALQSVTTVNPVERLSAEDSSAIYSALSHQKWKVNLTANAIPSATLSEFIPARTAAEAFPIASRSRRIGSFLESVAAYARGDRDPNIQIALRYWANGLDTPEGGEFVEFLRELFPGRRFRSERDFREILFGSPPLIEGDRGFVQSLQPLLSKLPKRYLDGVAEYWAIGNILGIPDLDSSNALWDETSLIGIDLAFRSVTFLAGFEFPSNHDQSVALDLSHNFREIYSAALGRMLRRRLTPDFIRHLERLTPEELQQFADDAGLILTLTQRDGMISRIHHFK